MELLEVGTSGAIPDGFRRWSRGVDGRDVGWEKRDRGVSPGSVQTVCVDEKEASPALA